MSDEYMQCELCLSSLDNLGETEEKELSSLAESGLMDV